MNGKYLLLTVLSALLLLLFGGCVPSAEESEDSSTVEEDETASVDYAAMMRSVVAVECRFYREDGSLYSTSYGSAAVLSVDGDGNAYAVTNLHVLNDTRASDGALQIADDIKVAPYGIAPADGVSAEFVRGAQGYDVAVLRIAAVREIFPAVQAVSDAISREALLGEEVYAIGNTFGNRLSLTRGVISVKSEYVTMKPSYAESPITLRQIRFDAAVNEGNSGGALFAADGSFLGLVNARYVDTECVGYAIPANVCLPLARELADPSSDADALSLGVTLKEVGVRTSYDEESGRIETVYEVTVDEVKVGSPGALFLEKGDRLLAFAVNGGEEVAVTRMHHLEDILVSIREGDTLTLRYLRGEREIVYTLTVTEFYIHPIS